MTDHFDILDQSRKNTIKFLDQFSIEELNKIPAEFKNNLAWNAAHLVVTQQLLCYKLAGQAIKIPEGWVEKYKKGTVPTEPLSVESVAQLKALLNTTATQIRFDYEEGLFDNYTPYETSFGYTLGSIEQAIAFNNLHEGLHFGYMLALRKCIKA